MVAVSVRKGKGWLAAGAVGLAGAVILGVALLVRTVSPTPPPAPARPLPLTKFSDEGSLTRRSPEEQFLSAAASVPPKESLKVDPRESRRILGGLREIFVKMKVLFELYKKADPARYAAEMERLKEELTRLLQEARVLLKESEAAVADLFKMIREEYDPVLKERMAFLLRFVGGGPAGNFAAALSESTTSADRKVAIGVYQDLHTLESANALIRRAAVEIEMDLRQRAIIALGHLLSATSPDYGKYQSASLAAIRQYTGPLNEVPIRAAAWDALSYPPSLSPDDQQLIREALHAEKDPVVHKSVENAYRHMNVRIKAESDRLNPKGPAPPPSNP
jgi:hypothetical protein